MLIAFYVLLCLLLLLALFFTLLHPLLCIVDCALSKEHPVGSKIVWIVATLMLGFIAALAYTLLGTQSQWLRKSTRNAFGVGVLCIAAALGISYTSPEVQALINEAGSKATALVELETQAVNQADALENFQEQGEQLSGQVLDPKDLVGEAADAIDSIPPGKAISTSASLQSNELEQGQYEPAEIAVDLESADLESENLRLQTQKEASELAQNFLAEWGDALSILDEPIGQFLSESGSDLPAEPSATADLNAEVNQDMNSQQGPSSDAPASPIVESDQGVAGLADADAKVHNDTTSRQEPSAAKWLTQTATAIGTTTNAHVLPSKTSPSTTSKAQSFNRYRGTSKPLDLDFPTSPIRNRYINQ